MKGMKLTWESNRGMAVIVINIQNIMQEVRIVFDPNESNGMIRSVLGVFIEKILVLYSNLFDSDDLPIINPNIRFT